MPFTVVVGLKNNSFVPKAILESKLYGNLVSESIGECITSLHETDLKIWAVILDSHSANEAAYRELSNKHGNNCLGNAIIHTSS